MSNIHARAALNAGKKLAPFIALFAIFILQSALVSVNRGMGPLARALFLAALIWALVQHAGFIKLRWLALVAGICGGLAIFYDHLARQELDKTVSFTADGITYSESTDVLYSASAWTGSVAIMLAAVVIGGFLYWFAKQVTTKDADK